MKNQVDSNILYEYEIVKTLWPSRKNSEDSDKNNISKMEYTLPCEMRSGSNTENSDPDLS